jgi:hypothetical protein
VGPGAGLDYVEKRKFLTLPGLELQPLGHPAHSQTLYRLLNELITYINVFKCRILIFIIYTEYWHLVTTQPVVVHVNLNQSFGLFHKFLNHEISLLFSYKLRGTSTGTMFPNCCIGQYSGR